jgi:LmbE family N-acetylglucosaminyl deacetylase
VTVFANDPDSEAPASSWDAACGFRTEGEAARLRREEDRRACQLLAATPIWLPFRDKDYGRRAEEGAAIWASVAESALSADTVLTPGFPLYHPDHSWLTRLVLEKGLPGARVGLYVEQPYATFRLLGRGRRTYTAGLTAWQSTKNLARIVLRTPGSRQLLKPAVPDGLADLLDGSVDWLRLSSRPSDRWRKRGAARAYHSQVRGFGPLVLARIALCEAAWAGEGVAWLHRLSS